MVALWLVVALVTCLLPAPGRAASRSNGSGRDTRAGISNLIGDHTMVRRRKRFKANLSLHTVTRH